MTSTITTMARPGPGPGLGRAWLTCRLVFACAALLVSGQAGAQGAGGAEAAVEAEQCVQALHEGLAETAAELGDASLGERYARLEPVILATHDLPYIAELAIRREWAGLDDSQRRRFLDAFERLSITTYASRFRNLAPGAFRVDGSERTEGGRVTVRATLTPRAADPIPFEYVLHETGDGWQIINILADGVSDLALKRAEYRRLLQRGSIDDLIADLTRQTEELAE